MADTVKILPDNNEIIDLTHDTVIDQNQFDIEAEIQHRIEEELRVEEENQRLLDEQIMIEAENQRRMEQMRQQEIQIQADHRLQLEEEERIRVETERIVRVRNVANEMRDASPTHFLPPITQIECVTRERYSVYEAITRGGDNRTPCQRCCRNDPDDCFWLAKTAFMNVEGRQIRTGRGFRNNQVRHYLYRSFIKEEYGYLVDGDEEDDIEGHVGIPRLPLPTCVESYIKRQFPNEDGRPFVGFRGRRRGRN